MTISPELAGKFYWPRDDFSTPADSLCWHIPPSPDADFRCVRPIGHRGRHQYAWSPIIRDYSHHHSLKDAQPNIARAEGK